MNATSRKISYMPPKARDIAPEQIMPADRIAAAAQQAEAASWAAFFEHMELAMTCTVLIGALLFAAALVRYGAPAGEVRDCAADGLYALAALGGVLLGVFTLRAIGRRIGCHLARRRG